MQQTDTEALVTRLSSAEKRVREDAAYSLGSLSPGVPLNFAALLEGTRSDDGYVRFWSLTGLGRIHQRYESIVPVIADCLADPVTANREAAASCLARYAEFSRPFITGLNTCARDDTLQVRKGALRTLGAFYYAAEEVMPCLIESLDDPEGEVRRIASIALKNLGRCVASRRRVLDYYIQRSPESPEASQLEAAISFVSYCDEVKSDELLTALRSGTEFNQQRAAQCVGELDCLTDEVLRALDGALDSSALDVQLAAARAVRRVALRTNAVADIVDARLKSGRWSGEGPEAIVLQQLLVASALAGLHSRP